MVYRSDIQGHWLHRLPLEKLMEATAGTGSFVVRAGFDSSKSNLKTRDS